ncbi:hypothetical protein [Henriciella marina]|jgi:hypothetical protein|uniref:Cell division protein ZapA n=1 Tax=Henriciella marina TaxID=453851 RepID=A0ABT4LUX2_9PROT|nr:hypothetical protein [Henriciella marina]MCZ4298161.1 hypothetical protein [Henriciella marina]
MKLCIMDGETVLLNLEDHRVDLPGSERDRATSMMLLSEALVLLANACEADAIEQAASEISDSIRASMTVRVRADEIIEKTRH